MAFTRPTLAELVDRIESDFISRLALSGAVLRRSMVRVLSRVIAGAAHMLHGHLDWIARQVFPDTAEDENLLRWGRLFAIEPTTPTFAAGSVGLTGANGNTVPAGSVLVRADGVEYTTDADATISSGVASVAITASVADEDSNCDTGVELTFQSPVSGVDAVATVDVDGIEGGTDEESSDDYRVRVLERLRAAPHGGNEADYVAWAKEVAGVTRAWVYRLEDGAGTVTVRFMRDDDVSPIPSAGEVTDVQDYIETKRPVTADVTVEAPVALPVNYTLHLDPDTTAIRTTVTAELTDFHSRETEPGVDLPISHIRTALGNAVGDGDYTLASPAADVTVTTGEIPTLGTINFT